MRTLPLALAGLLIAGPALADPRIHPPKDTHEAGLEFALVDDTWGGDGLGVGGHYEMVLVRSAGPGHVMGGGAGLIAFTDDGFRGCDREETIFSAAGRIRYVLDVSPVVKPHAGIGLGLYAVGRDYDNCVGPDDDSDLGIGIPVSLGLDFVFDAFTFGVTFNIHETGAGDDHDEDFTHVGLALGWRF